MDHDAFAAEIRYLLLANITWKALNYLGKLHKLRIQFRPIPIRLLNVYDDHWEWEVNQTALIQSTIEVKIRCEKLIKSTLTKHIKHIMRLTKSFDVFARDFSRIAELYPEAAGKDPEYLELLAASRVATPESRQAAISAAAGYLWDNQVTLYLSDEFWYFIVNNRVEGYRRAPLLGEIFVGEAKVSA